MPHHLVTSYLVTRNCCDVHYYDVYRYTGVEKNNDVAKRNYFFSNLHDPAGEILKTEGRLELTDAYKRPKRKYSKHNEQY